MNYIINNKQGQPAYLQLYNYIRNDIVAGVYARGDRLPSKRTIAAECGVSVITSEHAISLLCEEGYTEARERSGVYVTYRSDDFQGVAADAGKMPSLADKQSEQRKGDFPYGVLAKTMRRVLLDYADLILVRSPNRGLIELRNEIASYLERSRGIGVSPDRIVVGAGAEYLYGLIAQLLGRERIFAIEDPSYNKIYNVYNSLGIECERLTLGRDGITSRELAKSTASILHVTPFNSFPSGITATVSKKMEYIRWAGERSGYIIEDNYESELTVSKKPVEPIFKMTDIDNVIYINTFSKTIAPSLRAGYMILPERLSEIFDEKMGFYSCTVPVFEQYVLTELLHTGDFERHINRVRRNKRRSMP
jgi:GntR family transcriptional regulator/MocR family aminotransferase